VHTQVCALEVDGLTAEQASEHGERLVEPCPSVVERFAPKNS